MKRATRIIYDAEPGDPVGAAAAIGCLGFVIGSFVAWATHIVWVIGKLAGDAGVTGGQVILGIIGTAMPPVGVVHGVMIWFGAGMG